MNGEYEAKEPAREEVDRIAGPLVIEFGNAWCGYCRAAQPLLATALAAHPQVKHLKIADGSGRRLGRSFRVKLWPTLVFLRDGVEADRIVRPDGAGEIAAALDKIDPVAP